MSLKLEEPYELERAAKVRLISPRGESPADLTELSTEIPNSLILSVFE